MAAQDYYNSFAGPQSTPSYPQPQSQAPQQQLQPQQRPPSFAPSTAPPPYSPYPGPNQQGSRPGSQGGQAPYYPPPPNSGQNLRPPGQYPGPNQYDGGSLKPARSHSSPPDDYKHHHHHHHSDSDSSRSRSRSRSHSRSRRHSHTSRERGFVDPRGRKDHHKTPHRDMDTFLGAGGGAIIGDAIFPGLGTIGGLILGGVGGREYAKRKERSQDSRKALRDADGGRRSRSSVPDYRY